MKKIKQACTQGPANFVPLEQDTRANQRMIQRWCRLSNRRRDRENFREGHRQCKKGRATTAIPEKELGAPSLRPEVTISLQASAPSQAPSLQPMQKAWDIFTSIPAKKKPKVADKAESAERKA